MIMKRLFALMLALAMAFGCACAEVLTLPADTTRVEDRAFYDTAVTHVSLPAGLALENIGVEAFPSGTYISGPQEGLLDWAYENGYNYWARTRRALLIGQTYEGTTISNLPACANDAAGMATMLQANCAIPYQVTLAKNLTKVGILNAIKTTFAGAQEGDVSLFYYSGHGATDTGDLCPIDMRTNYVTVTMRELRNALHQVPGTKIVILDSCFSGNMVLEVGGEMKSKGEPLTPAQLASRQAAAFATDWTPRDGGVPEFIVITACSSDEVSWCDSISSYFTYTVCEGSGYIIDNGEWLPSMDADVNGDLDITQREIFSYVENSWVEKNQSVQAYPSGGIDFVLWGEP